MAGGAPLGFPEKDLLGFSTDNHIRLTKNDLKTRECPVSGNACAEREVNGMIGLVITRGK